ncbi:hypothetical protein QIS74_11390 [Colletotrichum tabaci]|uniref:Tautomerase cis-CaaD-like domain-containing protein n=1 Tax=Colletotrichum tabaci TaxID=1209068 RepID=A0AAV9SYG5_9PEZI
MPLWIIYHPEGTFEDDASKEAFSADITKFYTNIGLPAFYVVANFIKLPQGAMWVGGKKLSKDKPFIRISIEHIAVNLPDDDKIFRQVADDVDAILKPHVADKGYDWEFHIDETDRRLWKVQGLHAPAFGSAEEKIWVKENRAIPWEKSAL